MMPDKSKDLPGDELATLRANAKYVADFAERLDESGDARDQAGTESNGRKLQGSLKSSEGVYPPDTRKGGEK